ncbi:hypothetical protein H8E07_05155 [bacterium]|nr:hypothetical protein [bacterium]
MTRPLGSRCAVLFVLVLLSASAAAQTARTDAAVDSLSALLEDLAWAPRDDMPILEADTPWRLPVAWSLEGGTTPAARWCRVGAAGGAWRLRALRRHANDETRTAWHAAITTRTGDLVAGQLSLHAGCGQLLGAAGGAGPPSASRSLAAGGEGWRPYAGRPQQRSFTGATGVLDLRGWELLLGGGERDLNGRRGEGGRTRFAVLSGRNASLSTALAVARDEAGAGGSLAVGVAGADARCRAELCGWAPPGVSTPRWAAVVTAALHGTVLEVEGQLAVRDQGHAPAAGVRPQALPADGRRGWALRARWQGPGVRCGVMVAGALCERRVGDFPAAADVRRLELVLQGGAPRRVSWRGRLSVRSETVTGWSERLPWLPPALVSSRRETRLSARVSGDAASVRVRAAAGAAGLAKRLADGTATSGWRAMVSLRTDARLGSGLELRFNQVWAWGEPVDLVSVEVPAAGFARPRHWGRRAAERSLGVGWQGAAWRLSAAVCLWDVADGGHAHEVLAGLRWGGR